SRRLKSQPPQALKWSRLHAGYQIADSTEHEIAASQECAAVQRNPAVEHQERRYPSICRSFANTDSGTTANSPPCQYPPSLKYSNLRPSYCQARLESPKWREAIFCQPIF